MTPAPQRLFCAVCLRTRTGTDWPNLAATLISGLAVCREHIEDIPSATLDHAVERVRGRKKIRQARAALTECHSTTVPCGFSSCEVHYPAKVTL